MPSWPLLALTGLSLLGFACGGKDPRELWRFETFSQRPWHGWCTATEPVVHGDTVFVGGGYAWGTGRTYLHALNRHTGSVIWATRTNVAFVGGPHGPDWRALAVVGHRVVASLENELVALDASDGRRLWSIAGRRPLRATSPTTIYSVNDAVLSAHDIESGRERWRTSLAGVPVAAPALIAGRLYVGSGAEPRRLYAFDAATGRLVDERTLAGFNGTIAQAGDKLLLESGHSGVRGTYILDPFTRDARAVSKGLLAVDGDTAYFDAGRLVVEALDVASNRTVGIWHNARSAFRGHILVSGDTVYQPSLDGAIGLVRAQDMRTGQALWSFRARDWVSGMALSSQILYVSSQDCRVYALRA